MARRLIVAALDIEVAQNGFTYYWCDDGDPSFEEVDKGGVGAELLCGSLPWKYQALSVFPGGKITAPHPFSTDV